MVARISPVGRTDVEQHAITLSLPPDKSILHRLLCLGSLTTSAIQIPIDSPHSISHDIIATVLALESLGVPVDIGEREITIQGVGLHGYRTPTHAINCANSGTTARLLMGLLAGQTFASTLTGDGSLSKRPMKRLADVLALMGARTSVSTEGTLPVMIEGTPLRGAKVQLAVASAQMKTAVLFAALFADGVTTVREPTRSRDHTERMMQAFGWGIEPEGEITLEPEIIPSVPEEFCYTVPGDLSSAAFMIAAAALLRRRLILEGVSLNPSRTRFLELLTLMGVELEAQNITEDWNEPRGNIITHGDGRTSRLQPFRIDGRDVPLLIDELPILMVLALFAEGESSIRGASELRLKEADRIALAVRQFHAFGVECEELEDGIIIQGVPDRLLRNARIEHDGDHRLAMAFSIAALFCDAPSEMPHADVVAVSYPEFFSHLSQLIGEAVVEVEK